MVKPGFIILLFVSSTLFADTPTGCAVPMGPAQLRPESLKELKYIRNFLHHKDLKGISAADRIAKVADQEGITSASVVEALLEMPAPEPAEACLLGIAYGGSRFEWLEEFLIKTGHFQLTGRAPQDGDGALAVFVTEMESKYEGQWPRAKFEALAKSRPTVFLGLRMGETKKMCARSPYIPSGTSMIGGVELFHFGYGNLSADAQCNRDGVAQLQKLCSERRAH